MDVNGAKALKRRLGQNGADEAPRFPADVPEGAPPVYRWVGVSQAAREALSVDTGDQPATQGASLLRRLGLSFR